jgi:hypothetical protein
MFNLREFIKNGLLMAVGNMADYQVILNAAGWHEKGVLAESDLADIQAAIDVRNANEHGKTLADGAEDTTTEPNEVC